MRREADALRAAQKRAKVQGHLKREDERVDSAISSDEVHDATLQEKVRESRTRPVFSGISGCYVRAAWQQGTCNKIERPVFSGLRGVYIA